MWLADPSVSSGGITGIVVAAIVAIGGVVVAWLQRGRGEDGDPTVIVNNASPAIEAAATQGAESAAAIYREELVRERREKDELQIKYDDLLEQYKAALRRSGARPSPERHDD